MNYKKWHFNNRRPLRQWIAKLGEEFGEVVRELSKDEVSDMRITRAVEELEHVEFIASQMRMALQHGKVEL